MSLMRDYCYYNYNRRVEESGAKSGSDLILNTFGNNGAIIRRYKEDMRLIKDKLKKYYMDKVNAQLPNPMGEKEFFEMMDDLQNNVIEKAAEKMNSQIDMPGTYGETVAAVAQDASNLQRVFGQFKKIAEQIAGSSFSKNPLPIITKDMISGKPSAYKILQKYREAYLNSETTFKVDASYTRAIAEHAGQINTIMSNLSALEAIQAGGISEFGTKIESDAINKLIDYTWRFLKIVTGFVSEDNLKDDLEEFLSDDISSMFSKDNVTITSSGTQQNKKGIKVKTEDIAIEMDFQKMLKGETGTMKVKLPGISVKRTDATINSLGNPEVNIRIKGTSMGNYLEGLDDDNIMYEFFNAYACYNMALTHLKQKAALGKENQAAMDTMYDYMHACMLPIALAGNMNYEDFAYFLVVNDKVYNMIDILEDIIASGDFSSVSSELSQKQTGVKNAHNSYWSDNDPTGKQRSDAIIAHIRNLKNITMHLRLALKI